MEKRRVTVSIGGQSFSFYSDDSDDYIAALEKKANAAMRETAGFSGLSAYNNAVLAVLLLSDRLLRAEQERQPAPEPKGVEAEEPPKGEQKARKTAPKAVRKEDGQVSMWDLLGSK